MPRNTAEHLRDWLSDAYSMEQQALAQLRTAPEIAGERGLATAFREHLHETEHQAELVRERLEAYDGSPSRIKDAVMRLGGKGFLLFARVQPDTPGKLLAHAHSYEAMEWAAYETIRRTAERLGDGATAETARAIRDQERAMMQRLASSYDAAVEASLERVRGAARDVLPTYLADAHAIEEQSAKLLEKGPNIAGDPELERIYREHLAETRDHAAWIEERLAALDEDSSKVKDLALRAAATNWGLFFQAQRDTPAKLAVFAYAVEHLEIASHELLRRVAERAGDRATVRVVLERILPQERAMAERVESALDIAIEASLAGVAAAT